MNNSTTITPDLTNEMFQLADQLVNQSCRNIFLTGKAGTGKTTFLKHIRQNCNKHIAVVAPTGVAAINAGGVTIHSFFQLPISPFIPNATPQRTGVTGSNEDVINTQSLLSRLRMTNEKKNLLQELELLIIDEISMVRCDTIDAIDTVLRHVRQRPQQIFGGVQVLFIGDMLQLPPVINGQEWQVLSGFYSSQYFFDSIVLKSNPPVHIEFNKIYRQSDQAFIDVLNQVRNNEMDETSLQLLNSRFTPNFRPLDEGYIILTTHNNKARETNQNELDHLSAKQFSYRAEIEGDFFEKAYPADEILNLKTGAQVMFIKNDSADRGKRYFNGKIGIISFLDKDKITVQCADSAGKIEVQKETWENIRYTFNKANRQLDEEVLGAFKQYPLRLAWAITIHKSQGLTFEKAIIDAEASFSPGQVYVALSRCTTLQGMILQSRIRPSGLLSDERIVNFCKQSSTGNQLTEELMNAKINYQLTLLSSVFDFSTAVNHSKYLYKYMQALPSSFNATSVEWCKALEEKIENLQDIAHKFQQQLKTLILNISTNNEINILKERVKAAAIYFINGIKPVMDSIVQTPLVTDSRLHAKEVNESLRELFSQLSLKRFLLEDDEHLPDIEAFHKRKKSFQLQSFSVNVYAGASQKITESPHPILHQQLRKVREDICSKKNMPIYIVVGSCTID